MKNNYSFPNIYVTASTNSGRGQIGKKPHRGFYGRGASLRQIVREAGAVGSAVVVPMHQQGLFF